MWIPHHELQLENDIAVNMVMLILVKIKKIHGQNDCGVSLSEQWLLHPISHTPDGRKQEFYRIYGTIGTNLIGACLGLLQLYSLIAKLLVGVHREPSPGTRLAS